MSTKSAFQIAIPRRSYACSQCNEPFAAGKTYYSILGEERVEGDYPRLDYCQACWTKQTKSKTPQYSSAWSAAVPLKKEASELPKQRDARALYLLKQTLNQDDKESNAEAFVLSLYLARRRRLYLRQEMKLQNGHYASLYEVAETEEMLCVPKLALSDLQVEKIQEKLATHFKG